MASRALGAFLALAAAAAIVVSIASSAWWAGTPVIDGKAFDAKYVHAGPLGATGCNVGGDGSCEPVAIDQTVQMIGYAELGAAALATLFLFVLLSAALRVSEHRRGIATTSLLFTLLAGGGAGALLALGPGIQASQVVEVPIGWGAYAFGGGIFASLLASLITRKLEPEPLRLKPTLSAIDPHAPTYAMPGHGNGNVMPAPAMHDAGAHDPRSQGGPLRMAPSTPALSGRATPFPASSPRIRPPQDASSPRVTPSPDAEPVNPFARTDPPSEAAPMGSEAAARESAARMSPPGANARDSASRMSPPGANARDSAPRMSPSNVAARDSGQRIKSPSEVPLPGVASVASEAPRNSVGRSTAPGVAPIGSQPDAARAKPPSIPPTSPRSKPPTNAPADPRAKLPTSPPGDPRAKPPTSPPGAKSPTSPPGAKPQAALPGVPRANLPGLPRTKAPSVPPVRPIVPSPVRSGKSIVVPEHLRASTEQGTPPPTRESGSVRPSQPGLSAPPSQHKTIAHAIPPMPVIDGDSRRAQTEDDDSLDEAMRPTDFVTAVEIDHEAKAAAQHEAKTAAQHGAKAAVQSRAGADERDDDDDDHDDVNDRDSDDDDDDDDASSGAPNRAGTDVRTGKNPLAGHAIGEATKVGLAAAPPAPALLPEDALEFERDADAAEATTQGPPPQPEDLMKTFEQNPKTPIPTMDRIVRSGESAERPAQVPLSTAPTSLPPPKQLDAVPSGPTPACPQCESPMSWVEEHLRFYCRQCRMYF